MCIKQAGQLAAPTLPMLEFAWSQNSQLTPMESWAMRDAVAHVGGLCHLSAI